MQILWAGFLLGFVFGAITRVGDFCIMHGLRQAFGYAPKSLGSSAALQGFILAMAVALLASQGLHHLNWIDLNQSNLARSEFSVLGILIGGIFFGFGMTFANGCGGRSLVLLAGGNLRALVTLLFIAMSAQSALTGVLQPAAHWLQTLAPIQLEYTTHTQALMAAGWSSISTYLLLAVLPASLLMFYALYPPALRHNKVQCICAILIGLLIAMGWWMTTTLGADPATPDKISTLSFVGTVAESLLYLQLASGRSLSLGPVIIAGVFLGALVMAIATRTLRWEGFKSPQHLAMGAVGGILMGFGGVVAAGSTIGQGLAGVSTLSWASFPVIAGIVLGCYLCLNLLNKIQRMQ